MRQALEKSFLYLLFGAVIPFLMLEGVFRLLPVASPPHLESVTAADPVPHFQPNRDYLYAAGWNFPIRARKHTNNFGFNHVADYHPAESSPLLAVIGDSFVEAHEVDAGKSAAEILHAKLAPSGRVYGFGISGAPLSQYLAFARFARAKFKPAAMAFVIIGNDFDESLLKYKSEPRLHYFTDDGRLQRIDYEISPLKKVLRNSAFLRYTQHHLLLKYRLRDIRRRLAGGEAADPELRMQPRIPDSRRAVDYFLAELPASSGLAPDSILLVLDADRPAIYSDASLRQAENGYHAQMRRYLGAQARARGFQVLDLQPVFIARHRRDNARFEFPTDSHWNELGQRVVADEIERSTVFARVFREQPASQSVQH